MSTLPLLPTLSSGPWRRAVWSPNAGPSSGGQARGGAGGRLGRGGGRRGRLRRPQSSRRQPTAGPQRRAPLTGPGCRARRRGSSVALVLDVRSLGAVEPICSVNTPREVTLHFLRTAGRPLTRWALQHRPPSPQQLEEEFLVRTRGPCPSESQAPSCPGHCGGPPLRALRGEDPGLQGADGLGPLLCPVHAGLPAAAQRPDRQGPAPAETGRGERGLDRGVGCSFMSSPTRRSPQTLSTLKSWTSLATPPRTGTRPSCPVRTSVGAGQGRAVPGVSPAQDTGPQPGTRRGARVGCVSAGTPTPHGESHRRTRLRGSRPPMRGGALGAASLGVPREDP